MKIVFLLVCVFGCSMGQNFTELYGQRSANKLTASQMPRDPEGKIAYIKVQEAPRVSRDSLYDRSLLYAASLLNSKDDKIVHADRLSGLVEATTSVMVYKPGTITKTLSGRVTYRVAIQSKEGKYRFMFSDFVFQPYKQFRQTNEYKPVAKDYKPFEKAKYPGSQSLWYHHKATIDAMVKSQIVQLDKVMKEERKEFKSDTIKVNSFKTSDW